MPPSFIAHGHNIQALEIAFTAVPGIEASRTRRQRTRISRRPARPQTTWARILRLITADLLNARIRAMPPAAAPATAALRWCHRRPPPPPPSSRRRGRRQFNPPLRPVLAARASSHTDFECMVDMARGVALHFTVGCEGGLALLAVQQPNVRRLARPWLCAHRVADGRSKAVLSLPGSARTRLMVLASNGPAWPSSSVQRTLWS